jgi:hypothetical protein
MRRFLAALRRRIRRAKYRLTVEPPAWADNDAITTIEPLDHGIRTALDSFRG